MGIVYPNEIQRILNSPGGDVGKYARRIALDIAAESKRIAEAELGRHPGDQPRTGKLAKSYRVTVLPGTNTFRVNNSQYYSAAIELGAAAHKIKARRVEYLRFTDRQGRARRVKLVFHLGNPAFRLMSRAADNIVARRFGTTRLT